MNGEAGAVRRDRLPLLVVLALVWMAVGDWPTTLSLGPLSVSGAATLLAGVATVVLAPMLVLHGRGRSAPRSWNYLIPPGARRPVVPVALVLFCAVALLGALRAGSQSGVQQASVYLGFAGAIAVGALYSEPGTARRFLELTGVVMCLVGAFATVTYLMDVQIIGPRSYALAATVAVAVLVPYRSERLLVRLAPYVLTAGIAASLSRTALVVAVLLLAFAVLRSRRGKRGFRIVLALVVLAILAIAAFLSVPSLRDRFLVGDNGVDVGGVALNTSGRAQIWAVVIQDSLSAPWIGQGAGTASDLLAARYPDIAQPHDDYLRIWHDFGLVGLALFLVAVLTLLIGAIRRVRRADHPDRAVHWSATLGLLAVGAAALTDNPVIYPFVMLPLGVVVGLSIAGREALPAARAGHGSIAGREAAHDRIPAGPGGLRPIHTDVGDTRRIDRTPRAAGRAAARSRV
ncbi:O-antigen ligase family protein [uncultured Amnibacterium sp.]|uniref:O-antigen ligase family protein n=1 Tax=uncultured Amnibacterium sp. TaxID=1631851 RepID=UPI0035C99B53